MQICHISVVFSSADSPVLTSRVAVTVHVLDINEFPPELASPYETFVCENSKAGQVLSHVFCTHYAFVVSNTANCLVLKHVDYSVVDNC